MLISRLRTGVALGALIGLWHAAWSTLVAIGWAQPVLDFILRLHFIKVAVVIQPFDIGLGASLVAITTAVGFVVGVVFAALWNWTQRGAPDARRTARPAT